MFSIKNERGFSQINLFIGVFFLALVVFIVMNTIKKQTDSLRNITAEAEIENYLGTIKKYLSSPMNCNETFQDIAFDEGSIKEIKVLQSNKIFPKFRVNTKFGASETKIMNYQTSAFNNFDENISELGMINLVISLKKSVESSKSANVQRSVKLYIRKSGESIRECAFGGLPRGEKISEEKPSGLILNSSFVGINTQDLKGNLNIPGSLTLAPSLSPCTSENLGSIQFNGTLNRFEQCKKDLMWKKVHR